jgi:hypothetical protein
MHAAIPQAIASAPTPLNAGLMLTADAAHYLMMSPRNLERYRMTGGGPRFMKSGRRCLYRRTDLDTWLNSRSFENTAQARKAGCP